MRSRSLILAADDEEICLSILTSMIERLGFSTITARDGKEAIAIYKQQNNKILFILLDIHMPLINGVQASQQIKNICEDAKLIFVTGETNEALWKEARSLNPLAILKKPLSFNELSMVLVGNQPRK